MNPLLVEPEPELEPKPPRPPKRKSESGAGRAPSTVWDHFDKVVGTNGKRRAVCKYCKKEYMVDSRTHGTSNLRSHTPNCKEYPNRDTDGQQTLNLKPKQNEEGAEVVATIFNFDTCKRALAEMVVIDELPFRFVEGVGFRRFCNVMQPKFTPIPSHQTISKEVLNIFKNERDKLKKAMKGRRICFTTNTWTSIQNLCYMCLTAHFIDDNWKLQKRIINFQQVEDYKGETLGRKKRNISTGGRILDPFRSSLSPSMVEALVCTQNWLRSNLPISLQKAMNDVEEFEQYDSGTLESSSSSTSTYNVDAIINGSSTKCMELELELELEFVKVELDVVHEDEV
ncbi:hypothetical protein ACSBR2_004984 [Camellia fascicularis]